MAEKEYIEREAAYPIAKKVVDAITNGEYHAGVFAYDIMDWIDELPASDVRPVVYCKDCKCYQQSSFVDKHMECARSRFPVHSVDFCSFGEKREES